LSILNRLKLKALFFVVGENCRKNPSLVKDILSEGHTIGNHTFNHKIILHLTKTELDAEINNLNELFLDKFNYQIKYFRPPHGRFNLSLSKYLLSKNMENVMWSLLTFDYKNNSGLVKFAVEKYLTNKSIIVLHDSIKSKQIIKESIEFIYEHVNQKGYEFGEAAECLK
jgi:peptidoglycan-N-acetylglucosamine deacetylase